MKSFHRPVPAKWMTPVMTADDQGYTKSTREAFRSSLQGQPEGRGVKAAVYGAPDPISGETVQASVVLNDGFEPDGQLLRELLGYARKRLGTRLAPQHIDFTDQLPKNRAGKIMRRLLKEANTHPGEPI